MPRRVARLKAALHPWLDPVLSIPDQRRARRALTGLADGEYRAGVDVPYCAQFASPERIYDYIDHRYDGAQDPNWRIFGADDPADYAFWAPRVCALACLKMAVEAFSPTLKLSLWELVQEGLAREVVRRVQDLRKKADFRIEDRITTYYTAEGKLAKAIIAWADYIKAETLTEELIVAESPHGAVADKATLDGDALTLAVRRR